MQSLMLVSRRTPRNREVPGSAGILPAACVQLQRERRAGCPRYGYLQSSRNRSGRGFLTLSIANFIMLLTAIARLGERPAPRWQGRLPLMKSVHLFNA